MVQRWQWATLAIVTLAFWVGCSSSSKRHPATTASAGMANAAGRGTSGSPSGGGEAGDQGQGGGLGPKGGSAGATAVGGKGHGGLGGLAGMAAVGGVSGVGGVARPTVPLSWTCAPDLYADGTCHCGCGILDADCESSSVDACEVCDTHGSCSKSGCPGGIQADSNALCTPPPATWRCSAALYADGASCDCGCGAVDPDCADATVGSCDVCDADGACGTDACPGLIDPLSNAGCRAPPHWTCAAALFGDGQCDCGCGILDIDCADATLESCAACPTSSCAPFNCGRVQADNNALCEGGPALWTCDPALYADGSECDCGCGYQDPDCDANDIRDCDQCDAPGACSAHSCPGTIDLDNIGYCQKLTPPAEWTCTAISYADGFACDCGCGAEDPDCKTNDISWCDNCGACGQSLCPDFVDPSDSVHCIPAPAGWLCDAKRYGNGYCECGCGVADIDCGNSAYCISCPSEGCAHGDCTKLDAQDNTKCSN